MKKGFMHMRRCTYVFLLTMCFSLVCEPLVVYSKKSYKDIVVFMHGLLKNPHTVGALTPSSGYVAQELAMPLCKHNGPKNVLEIGAGTGQITSTIVKNISSEDTLDIVELNTDFCEILTNRYKDYSHINVFSGSILDWKPEKKYDFIICTLPFNRFSIELVDNIVNHVKSIAHEKTMFSYIELKYLSYFKKLVLSAYELKQHALVSAYMQKFNETYCKQKVMVFRNFPPAQVFHCQLKEEKVTP